LAGLLLSYLAPYISPTILWQVAFFGLLHPVFLIFNILFLIYWLVRQKLRFIFNLVVLVLGIGSINKIFTFGSETSPNREGKLKIISYNAKVFGAYDDDYFFDEFLKKITEENPDVLCIQEYFRLDLKGPDPINEIKKSTGLKYHYFRHTRIKPREGKPRYGGIIFSKNKIINYGEIDFAGAGSNLCLFADIKFNNKIIRIYSIHLQSIKFAGTDYQLLNVLGENYDSAKLISKNMFTKLKTAFIKRGEQANLVKESIRSCGIPAILCGDFNDTPQSYAYHTISENMIDCFMESGNGLGGTFVGPLPSLRIDYILHDTSMVSYNYNAEKAFSSDHKMIEALVEVK